MPIRRTVNSTWLESEPDKGQLLAHLTRLELVTIRKGFSWYYSRMKTLACILLLCSSALGADKREFHTYDGPFDLRITQVRSIAPEKSLGPFTKSLPLFAV
jgi:hypothetical protein